MDTDTREMINLIIRKINKINGCNIVSDHYIEIYGSDLITPSNLSLLIERQGNTLSVTDKNHRSTINFIDDLDVLDEAWNIILEHLNRL